MLTPADLKTLRDIGILADIEKHPDWYLGIARIALEDAIREGKSRSRETVRQVAVTLMASQLMGELRWLKLIEDLDPWAHDPTVKSYATKVAKYLINKDDPRLLAVPPI